MAIQPRNKKVGTQMQTIKYKQSVSLFFPENIKREILKQSNLHHLGVENCNKYCEERKCYVAAFPEKETLELKETHWRASAGFSLNLEVEVDAVNGEVVDVVWKKK
jgi:hypothetical protein